MNLEQINEFFQLGTLTTTISVNHEIKKSDEFKKFCDSSINRHKSKDWGDLVDEDKALNDDSLLKNGRIFSSYKIPDNLNNVKGGDKIWIITEWDRSYTTILFPSEY